MFDRLVFFKHLEDGEKVLYVIHKHWVAVLKKSLEISFFGFLIPWSFYALGFNAPTFFWIAVIWSALAYLKLMHALTDWFADAVILTDRGLLDVAWNGFFNNQATRVGYEDIEGVQYQISGFWASVLRYGNFTLRLNSGKNYIIPYTASPKRAELEIARCQDQVLNHKNKQNAAGLKSLLADMIAHHYKSGK